MRHLLILVTTVAGLLCALWGVRCYLGRHGERCSPETEDRAMLFLLAGAALETVSIIIACFD